MGMELTLSTCYHPQTDGHTEIVNKWLDGYLRNYVSGAAASVAEVVAFGGVLLQHDTSHVH